MNGQIHYGDGDKEKLRTEDNDDLMVEKKI